MSELKPEGVKILIEPDVVKDKTDGGLYLPDQVKDDKKYATVQGAVLAIGPNADVKFEDGPLDIGDKVIYAKYGGVIVDYNGKECKIVNDEDILAKMT